MVFWNITNKCNLACTHCYINARPELNIEQELSLEGAKALIDDLAEMRVPLLLFTGGEPLVRRDFWELAAYATAKGQKTALSTNGTLITKEIGELPVNNLPILIIIIDTDFTDLHRCYCLDY